MKQENEVFEQGSLAIDFTARTVCVDGERLSLSPKEYDLLFYLVKNRGIALTRERLITEVWGYDFYGDDRTLDTHIAEKESRRLQQIYCYTKRGGIPL